MLDELNDIFMEVKDDELSFENIPDGEYLAVVTGAEYKMSKNDKPMVQFSFKITEGEYEGRVHNKFMMLSGTNDQNLKANLTRYGNELKKYGIVATSIQNSFDQLGTCKNREVKLSIKTNEAGFTHTTVELI